MNPQFVQFQTPDNLLLPGLFFHKKNNKTAVIWLHGNGSSSVFYSTKFKEIAPELLSNTISLFAFNNRGAYMIHTIRKTNDDEDRELGGTANEAIKDCVFDINGAVTYLKTQGIMHIYIVGHSTGANKICVYDDLTKKNDIAGYVLLAGGDDTGIYMDMLGEKKHKELISKAKEKIEKGNGEQIMKEVLSKGMLFTYRGFYDIANPDSDYNCFPFYEEMHKKVSKKPLFRAFSKLSKPSFVIYGQYDEYAWGDVPRVVEILKKYNPRPLYKIIPNADHSFTRDMKTVATEIALFINKLQK